MSYYILYCSVIAVTSQDCTDIVGSLSHNGSDVDPDPTFILADYIVPCSGTVVAWEFCYQRSGVTSVTFYPGIWRITGTRDSNTDYALVQSNNVTYDPSVQDSQDPANTFPCQIVNLSDTDQFIAPAGSVVGLYASVGTQLLHTDNNDSSITTYRFCENQSSVSASNSDDVNYNIAIRVYVGK